MTRPRASLLLSLFVSIVMLAATGITSATNFRTSDVTGQGYGDVMSGLVGPEGRAHSRDDFKGRVTVLLFGFTYCPDICPTALVSHPRGVPKKRRSEKQSWGLYVNFLRVSV
jgi:protein SCO1/2